MLLRIPCRREMGVDLLEIFSHIHEIAKHDFIFAKKFIQKKILLIYLGSGDFLFNKGAFFFESHFFEVGIPIAQARSFLYPYSDFFKFL